MTASNFVVPTLADIGRQTHENELPHCSKAPGKVGMLNRSLHIASTDLLDSRFRARQQTVGRASPIASRVIP